MVISTHNVIAQFRYSETEKSQLYKCIRMGSAAKCCDLFWDKIFSCCNQSSWDRALNTMRERVSHHPDCPYNSGEKISEFLMRYIISKEGGQRDTVPLLSAIKKNPMDELVAQTAEIDFFDLFHRVPYSDNALSYPDRETLFRFLKKEFKYIEQTTQKFSDELRTNPVIQAAKGVQASIDKMMKDSGTPKSAIPMIDQFEGGIEQTKAILEKVRPFLEERNFDTLPIERAYLHFKTLASVRPQILRLHEMMIIVTTGRYRLK